MEINIEILLTAVVVSSACALLGVFLVLKSMAMISDAITHTILLGIVIAFFIVHDLNSPFLIIGASITGVITVYLIDTLNSTKLVKEDSAIGIIFPFLFSIAVILISRFAGNIHLDIDSVLLGELAFVPFNRIDVLGYSIPKGLLSTSVILIINLCFITIFFKELKLVTFDKILAAGLGFYPVALNYIFITLVSVTVVGSFETAGSVLIIAFMIGPAVTAYLLCDRLHTMILISIFTGILSSFLGFYISMYFDVSIAGTIAAVIGIIFLLVLSFSPKKGIIMNILNKRKQKIKFAVISMLIHLHNHKNRDEKEECDIKTIENHLNWDKKFLQKIIEKVLSDKYAVIERDILKITNRGAAYLSFLDK